MGKDRPTLIYLRRSAMPSQLRYPANIVLPTRSCLHSPPLPFYMIVGHTTMAFKSLRKPIWAYPGRCLNYTARYIDSYAPWPLAKCPEPTEFQQLKVKTGYSGTFHSMDIHTCTDRRARFSRGPFVNRRFYSTEPPSVSHLVGWNGSDVAIDYLAV